MKLMDKEGEVIEIILTSEEIKELIDKLSLLSEDKDHIHFSIDDENELMISHKECKLNRNYNEENTNKK